VRVVDGMTLTEKNHTTQKKVYLPNSAQTVLGLNSNLHVGSTDIVVDLEVITYKLCLCKLIS
jgi:hypothetical protein